MCVRLQFLSVALLLGIVSFQFGMSLAGGAVAFSAAEQHSFTLFGLTSKPETLINAAKCTRYKPSPLRRLLSKLRNAACPESCSPRGRAVGSRTWGAGGVCVCVCYGFCVHSYSAVIISGFCFNLYPLRCKNVHNLGVRYEAELPTCANYTEIL